MRDKETVRTFQEDSEKDVMENDKFGKGKTITI
jgi:hypothetical protein